MFTEALPMSMYLPLALGFFGLGTGYLVWGPSELFGFPARDASVDRAQGVWGIFLPGLMQVVTGIILFVGLTWFQVFKGSDLYMAAVAFTAYGIHWFALGWNRYRGNDPRPNVGMSVGFLILSVTGAIVFFKNGDDPVGILFIGLAWVYVSEIPASVGAAAGEKLLGLAHLLTGLWLEYLAVAVLLDVANGYTLWK